MKKFKHICNGIIWTLIVLYLLLIVLMHLPSVQTFLGKEVAEALADKFGTKVEVGKVNLGFFNRIIIDDVRCTTSRATASFMPAVCRPR